MKKILNLSVKNGKNLKNVLPNSNVLYAPFEKSISRLNYKTDLFKFDLQSETVAELEKISKSLSWEECCAKRALDLLKLDREEYWFSYSGGIDSTNMLCSILKFWPAKELERVSIIMSQHSIEENPTFFNKYVAKMKLMSAFLPLSKMLLERDALMLTGELGDQLFGADILGPACRTFGNEVLHKDYREFAPKVFGRYVRTKEAGLALFEHFHPIVEESPIPIKTCHDFFWWLNFSQKWQYVKFRFIENKDWDLRARQGTHIAHFYDSPEFQVWSLRNHDLKIRDTWLSYKFTAKEFIADFSKDPGQLNLRKIQSLEKTYVLSDRRIGVYNDYQEIMTYEELKDYVR